MGEFDCRTSMTALLKGWLPRLDVEWLVLMLLRTPSTTCCCCGAFDCVFVFCMFAMPEDELVEFSTDEYIDQSDMDILDRLVLNMTPKL